MTSQVSQLGGTLPLMASSHPRVQVTVDPELEAALREFAPDGPRSQAIRALALRGGRAIQADRDRAADARGLLRSIAEGADDRFDFEVSAELHDRR